TPSISLYTFKKPLRVQRDVWANSVRLTVSISAEVSASKSLEILRSPRKTAGIGPFDSASVERNDAFRRFQTRQLRFPSTGLIATAANSPSASLVNASPVRGTWITFKRDRDYLTRG
ncbi:hypothetical protein K0M31_004742, partial [Melipona bicolor]